MRKKALPILEDKKETGDSDVIATVLELKDVVIATDDRRLRNVCKTLGVKVTFKKILSNVLLFLNFEIRS